MYCVCGTDVSVTLTSQMTSAQPLAVALMRKDKKEEKTEFAYNESEKAEILDRIGNCNYTIQRSKGLGENQPDMLWQTTMCPETRRLIRVTPDDATLAQAKFELLLGDNLAGRKEHIAKNGGKYLEMIDVS